MRATVTGASGFVGSNLAIELLKQGHHVRALRRDSSQVGHLAEFPIEWVKGELGDVDSLKRAFSSSDVVFHCAALVSIRKRLSPELVATNVDGTRNVVAAAKRAGVARLVHCSSVAAVGVAEAGEVGNEATQWNFSDHGLADGYATTKHLAEELLGEQKELDVVIANPACMFGPYDAKSASGKLIVGIVRRRVPGYPHGANNFSDVRDVVRGMILLAEKGRRGERYILGGQNLTYRDVVTRIAKIAGIQPLRFGMPRWVATIMGAAGDVIERLGREPLLNSISMRYIYTDLQFSSEKAVRELGYRPTSVAALELAIADAMEWFAAHKML